MNISNFPILITQDNVIIRIYVENVIDPITLFYKSKKGKDCYKVISFPVNGIYTFSITELNPDTKYYYYTKSLKISGKFKTLPKDKEDVNFNMLSCFGYDFNFDEFSQNAIVPKKGADFNLLLGDNIYADYYYLSTESKILKFRPSITLEEYNKVYKERFFEIPEIRRMLRKSLNIILNDDHDIFDEWNSFYRSFEYSTSLGTNGFSELQIASNIIYSALSISDQSLLTPPPPLPITSQDNEYLLWSVRSKNYNESVMNGYTII
jgi:hypothetical protein